MRITLDIKDDRYRKFLDLIKTLDYVSVPDDNTTNPEWQINEVNERAKDLKNNPEIAIDFQKTIGDTVKRYDL